MMMPYDERSPYIQQIEQLLTTVVTCRGVIKYNLLLSDEQKHDLQRDIDEALDALRSFLLDAPVPVPLSMPTPVSSENAFSDRSARRPACMSAIPLKEDTRGYEKIVPRTVHDNIHEQYTLIALYRMYHSFISENKGPGLSAFINRFNEAMSVLHELQERFDTCSEGYGHCDEEAVVELMHQMRVFIADLYSIFMEFMRVLSETLQNNNVQLETEKLTSLSSSGLRQGKEQVLPESLHDLAPLFGIYETHQRLNQKRGLLTGRVGEATAFLEFLKERLPQHERDLSQEISCSPLPSSSPSASSSARDPHDFLVSLPNDKADTNKQREICLQLSNVSRLLHELSHLLTDYERATATLFVQ